ncbi:hypothetical protein [Actinomyces ruminis]|uniref:hypothetical protein n=1 Tax=Actinomyces ruminis TaxID=1937003 RepID=UPI001C558097|nr:hypothetical protein [Actinomyces ruminis]
MTPGYHNHSWETSTLIGGRHALEVFAEALEPADRGEVDVAASLRAAPQALRVVEFDDYAGEIFEGIATSLAWLRAHDV